MLAPMLYLSTRAELAHGIYRRHYETIQLVSPLERRCCEECAFNPPTSSSGMQELWPPNPKLFESATCHPAATAALATERQIFLCVMYRWQAKGVCGMGRRGGGGAAAAQSCHPLKSDMRCSWVEKV